MNAPNPNQFVAKAFCFDLVAFTQQNWNGVMEGEG